VINHLFAVKPSITISSNKTVNISTDVQFYCNATAKPAAIIKWYKYDLHRKPIVHHTSLPPVHIDGIGSIDCSTGIQNCSDDDDINHLCTTCEMLYIYNTQATDSICYECDAINDCDTTVNITCLTVQSKQ